MNTIKLIFYQPALGIMLFQFETVSFYTEPVAVHGQMKGGVIILHSSNKAFNSYLCLHFLQNSMFKSLRRSLTGFYLAARKFPNSLLTHRFHAE